MFLDLWVKSTDALYLTLLMYIHSSTAACNCDRPLTGVTLTECYIFTLRPEGGGGGGVRGQKNRPKYYFFNQFNFL